MNKKTNLPLIACRYKNKMCDSCYIGWCIEWTGDPPNDVFKLAKCLMCHGENK